MSREEVILAVPDREAWCKLDFLPFVFTAATLNYQEGHPFRYAVCPTKGCDTPDWAFNVAAGEAIRRKAHLLILDSDMGPNPKIFEMLSVDADVVACGLMNWFDKNGHRVPLVMGAQRDEATGRFVMPSVHPSKEPYEVAAAQTGGMFIRRHVIADARLLYDEWTEPEPPIFRTLRKPGGRPKLTCDYDFCIRAGELGYRIMVDPRAHSEHYKEEGVTMSAEYAIKLARANMPPGSPK